MKRTHKRLTRLLSAGLSLALLTTLLPGALAASHTLDGYEVDAGKTIKINANDFNSYCKDMTEDGETMYSIYFSDLPSSRDGELYYLDSDNEKIEVVDGETIYWEDFYYLVFEAEEDCDDVISIDFDGRAGRRSGEEFWGTLEIDVNGNRSSSSSDDLTYEIDLDDVFDFDYRDIEDYLDAEISKLWITDLPNTRYGTLYYKYDRSGEYEVEEDDDFDWDEIDDLTFVPDDEGTFTIGFDVKTTSGKNRTGEVTIEVGDGKSSVSAKTGDVTYYMDSDDECDFDADDFNDYSLDETDYDLYKICFDELPSSSKGVLYYDYYGDEDKVSTSDTFRYGEIDDLTFVSARNYEGVVTIPFTILNDDDETIEGDLVINVGVSGDAEVVVKLQGATGNPITFDADDFNDAVVDETGYNLNYVVFDYTSGRGGYLYFDYGGGSEDEVDDAHYYRSSSPSLDDVTFVPGSAAGTTTRIPFRGYTTNNKTVSGEVEITYVTLSSPSVITYTSNGLGVDFRASDFSAACAARGGSSLVSVTFPNPSLTGGQLYYSFTSPTKYRGEVISSVTYDVNGIYRLDGITFLPKAEYTGSVVIPYVGTDAAGITYNGNIQIMVTPPSTTTRFNDMGSYGWAVPGVEFLAAYGITTGTGTGTTYSPAGTLTRGDYILMLVRTFGFTADGAASGNFSDVKADAYYADALAVARALGIATADANGNFRPGDPVTRQDSMVFLYRAMQKAGRGISSAQDSFLTRFPDGAAVSAAARPAVAAMAQAGVIKGDQVGRLNPQGTLTRAEMAVILHRGLTL